MPSFASKLGSRRQAILLGGLALVLCLALVRWRSGPGASASSPAASPSRPNPTAAAGGAAADAAPTPGFGRARRASAKELNPDDVGVISISDFVRPTVGPSSDPGRDLFELREPTRPPVPTPTPAPPVAGDVRFIGPLPPPPPTPTPKPPDIAFKFIGTFGPKDHPIAVVQQGDEVFNVRTGDTLFGKFILRKVGYESIDVGFVGFPDAETRRLGITP